LGQDSKVDIIIYTLTGKRVLKRSFEKGRAGGKMGVNYFLWYGENGKNRTVANGGYLIKIKVNDYKGGSKEIYKKIAVLKF
jgi:flagellar hook assembly protein FlgD